MATRMQQRRGTAAQWISTNNGNGPILAAGEIGFESDTNKFKIGDGVNHWVDLTYFTDAQSIIAAINGIVDGAPELLNTLNELAAALGDDPNFLASMATKSYVDTAIGNIDALPSQTGNSGKYLTTDGSVASWGTVDLSSYATQSYVDTAVGNVTVDLSTAAGTNLDWNASTSQFDVDTAGLLTSPTISTQLTLDGTGDFTISADANIILVPTTTAYIGSAASGNEIATKSYADGAAASAAAAIVDSAPETLNTLNELAAAINDDASYAATITTALGQKAPLDSPTFTGTVDFTGATLTGIPTPSAATPTVAGTLFGLTTNSSKNAILGYDALSGSEKGIENVAIGYQAYKGNTGYNYTVAIGSQALSNTLYAQKNTAVGAYALSTNESGDGNTAIGYGAGWGSANANGSANVIIGKDTMGSMSSASYNTVVGYGAGSNLTTGSYNILVGTGADASSATASYEITLGSADITRLRIPGLNLDTNSATNGQVLGWNGTTGKFQWTAAGPSITTFTLNTNSQTTIDTVPISSFTTMEYTLSIKQGSKVRSSKVFVHNNGSSVDFSEYGVMSTGGSINGLIVLVSLSSTDSILTVSASDANTTNLTIKFTKEVI